MISREMTWRKKDELKLARYVQKFNTSLTMTARKFPEIADSGLLPERLNARAIRQSEITRKDFNNLMKSIDRWFKPKNREIIRKAGIPMTRWEYKETLYATQRINANKKKRRDIAVASTRQRNKVGKDISTADKIQQIKERLESGNYDVEDAVSAWKTFSQTVKARSEEGYIDRQGAIYYNNYHTAIYENFSDQNAKLYADFLEDFRLTGDELYELIGRFPALDIDYLYGPEEEENKFQMLLEILPYAIKNVFGGERVSEGMKRLYSRAFKRMPAEEREYLSIMMGDDKLMENDMV